MIHVSIIGDKEPIKPENLLAVKNTSKRTTWVHVFEFNPSESSSSHDWWNIVTNYSKVTIVAPAFHVHNAIANIKVALTCSTSP